MNTPQTSSVTNIRCTCGFLQHALRDKRYPVRLDAQVNEYYFDHALPTGGMLSIRLLHCPACGGIASESKRDQFFASLSEEEMQRIHERLGDYSSVADIERALGAPDRDQKGSLDSNVIRVLTYTKLSKSADVQFSIYTDGRVEGAIAPKQKHAMTAKRKRRTPSKTKRKKKL